MLVYLFVDFVKTGALVFKRIFLQTFHRTLLLVLTAEFLLRLFLNVAAIADVDLVSDGHVEGVGELGLEGLVYHSFQVVPNLRNVIPKFRNDERLVWFQSDWHSVGHRLAVGLRSWDLWVQLRISKAEVRRSAKLLVPLW